MLGTNEITKIFKAVYFYYSLSYLVGNLSVPMILPGRIVHRHILCHTDLLYHWGNSTRQGIEYTQIEMVHPLYPCMSLVGKGWGQGSPLDSSDPVDMD